MRRPPRLLHCTSEPLVFFGRQDELALLDRALGGERPSVVALVGPGGQGKTAIARHWLEQLSGTVEGVFLWSFYRGRDADLCLREWLAYVEGLAAPPEVSSSYCADRLLAVLRRERWAVVLDGAEVVQHEEGDWHGRFVHPDLGRLLEELASEPQPGVVVLTTRFDVPTLIRRPFAQVVTLDRLDTGSARELLVSLGVTGTAEQLDAAADLAGRHAKAVELLGTWLVRFHGGQSDRADRLPAAALVDGASAEEASVARVLAAFAQALPQEVQDVLALATSFRDPPADHLLLDYLGSPAVEQLLHRTWGRAYQPWDQREAGWLPAQIDTLVALRLLERVGSAAGRVIDAHPLVRRGFEHVAGPAGRRQGALARAGFLRGRPDRRRPETLEDAREAIELFHAHCDAGLWVEADSAYRALDNPKHRWLAPALERDLLARFFPAGDWRRPPLWPGFARWRSLAICLEMLGQFDEALEVYRPEDAALRGDALLALGRLDPLLETAQMPAPWQTLWQSYRCHALCLAGRTEQAVALARSLVPVDVYEWVHVFECLLRADRLDVLDPRSLLYRPPGGEHRWAELARRRLRADYLRRTQAGSEELGAEYRRLIEEYDRTGLPLERALTRLGYTAWLLDRDEPGTAREVNAITLDLVRSFGLTVLHGDALALDARRLEIIGVNDQTHRALEKLEKMSKESGLNGPCRP